jgi:phosphinothricin acetyltransferase
MSPSERTERIAITAMLPQHWPDVRTIYQAGMDTGNATFETQAPDWQVWDAGHLPDGRLVALVSGRVVGWAALAPVSRREVYRGVAEVSVYVATEARGRGVGKRLLHDLVSAAERAGIWTLQAAVFPENPATLQLHTAAGFRIVGRRERIGRMNGRWRDTLLLERRSSNAGVD